MVHRIEVTAKSDDLDTRGKGLCLAIKNLFGIKLESIRTRQAYTVDIDLPNDEIERLKTDLFADKVTETTTLSLESTEFDWLVIVSYKPGVTDNIGKTSKFAAEELLGRKFSNNKNIYTSVQYLLKGKGLERQIVEKISRFCLGTNPSTGANQTINNLTILSYDDFKKRGVPLTVPKVGEEHKASVEKYSLALPDDELLKISHRRILSLSLDEMKSIRDYSLRPDVINDRKKVGLDSSLTDVELEVLAQTWSEHCKHKIFNALIHYEDMEVGTQEMVDSLFNTYIKSPSESISKKNSWVISSFKDNAGVVRFNDKINVVDKIETHNTPSALDPYGGAMTGIVGVNRDPMGTGKGAKLIANIFGYCLGDPFYKGELYEGVLHPKIIRDGVHKAVIDGGNQSGIPLVRGREFFDERYTTRPLIYCGTIGIMPVLINGEPSHLKKADPADLIVMVGGRIGKDGIHGATFSSAELHKESPVQAVQIGDPITQKKMSDLLLEARDMGLYKCITDNGAGGLSSSVGEMAEYSNGCVLDLMEAPLKYQGLNPWEILVSEAQERMTVAVAPSKIKAFLELAEKRDVEATVLGYFADTGRFHVRYGEETVAFLDMNFLHKGLPRMRLKAKWRKPENIEPEFEEAENLNEIFIGILSRLNICSKENKLRQYDHEVKGLSVIKPLVGRENDTPSDATISLLEHGSRQGIIMAEGINPHYSDIDTYHMVASAIDEAVRRIIASGGKLPSKDNPFYALDNFCWNLSSLDNADGQFKLAQLVRACKALKDYCLAFKLPCISGKDSMKNVWRAEEIVEGKKVEKIIAIPPTLMFSARARISDVSKAVTMDLKCPGDLIYVVGTTYDETGGSEYYHYLEEKNRGKGFVGNKVPKVNAKKATKIYEKISEVIEKGFVHSVHTPTIGGLGVAFALTSFAGGYGMDVDLRKVPCSRVKRNDVLLFSESNSRFVVSIPEEKKGEFEKIMQGVQYGHVGKVTKSRLLRVKGLSGHYVIDATIEHLKNVWKDVMRGV